MRTVSEIMFDMEKLLGELHGHPEEDGHDLQHGEVLYLVNSSQVIHFPGQIETYVCDKTHPILNPIYGPKNLFKKKKK